MVGRERASMARMSTEYTCPDCNAKMLIVPPVLGQFRRPTDPPAVAIPPAVPDGFALVNTDEEGRFACPNPACSFASDWDTIVQS
jgi:hypothetical protein